MVMITKLEPFACEGCGSEKTIEEIRREYPNALSCCPERKLVTLQQWRQRAILAETILNTYTRKTA